jgi:DNA repair protein RadB
MKLQTLCKSLDDMLGGGFPVGVLSLIYGEAGTGKTTMGIQCAVNCAKMGLKTLYVDSDHTFSIDRCLQIAAFDRGLLSSILVLRPNSFEEQRQLLEKLDHYITPKVVLVVIDTITSLYRLEAETTEKTFEINRALHEQLAQLTQLAKERGIATLLMSQVHSAIAKRRTEPVAERLLRFWAKVIISLRKTPRPRVREAILEKLLGKTRRAHCFFKLTDIGIKDLAT